MEESGTPTTFRADLSVELRLLQSAIRVELKGKPTSWKELIELNPLSSSVLDPLWLPAGLLCLLLLLFPFGVIIAVISSSVSILEEDDAVDDMVECTELSVELRSERRESRMVLARKKSISAALDVAVGVGVLFPLELLAGEMGAASSSGGDTSCVLHNRWPPPPPTPAPPPPPPASDRLRSGCCCEVCNRLRMVRARRKASWLSFSSAASGEERRALQPPSFLGERRLNKVKKGISKQIWE